MASSIRAGALPETSKWNVASKPEVGGK